MMLVPSQYNNGSNTFHIFYDHISVCCQSFVELEIVMSRTWSQTPRNIIRKMQVKIEGKKKKNRGKEKEKEEDSAYQEFWKLDLLVFSFLEQLIGKNQF